MYVYSTIIIELIKLLGYRTYLELGVLRGGTFLAVCALVDKAVAVDTVKLFECPANAAFFVGTTDTFFKQNQETFECIFIDANHEFPYVKRDVENADAVLKPRGLLFLHDTDPFAPHYIAPDYCGDCYKILSVLKDMGYDQVTLPVERPGLTIAYRAKDRRLCEYQSSIRKN